jgi:hypothetical protein
VVGSILQVKLLLLHHLQCLTSGNRIIIAHHSCGSGIRWFLTLGSGAFVSIRIGYLKSVPYVGVTSTGFQTLRPI